MIRLVFSILSTFPDQVAVLKDFGDTYETNPNFAIAKFAPQGLCGKSEKDLPALSRGIPLGFPGPNPGHLSGGTGQGYPGFFDRKIQDRAIIYVAPKFVAALGSFNYVCPRHLGLARNSLIA
jgi:hypothetical protein